MKSIAMIEFRSIARGIKTADIMIKAANIVILRSTTICPGKYVVLVGGDTSSVKEALQVGLESGSPYIVSHTVIPNIDPQVIEAIEGFTEISMGGAIGVLEYYAVIDAIIGADEAVKISNVSIIEIRMGFAIGGKGFVVLTGDIDSVEVAVKHIEEKATDTGMLMETSVIQNVSPDLLKFLI